jgi:hypothetical protein
MGASSSDVTLKPLRLQAGDAQTGPSVAHAAAAGITQHLTCLFWEEEDMSILA